MGACNCLSVSASNSSSLADDISAHNEINGHMSVEADIDLQTRKLLLLGAGSSGKSTLLKQLRYLYIFKRGYPSDDLRKYRDIVFENLIQILTTLSRHCIKFEYSNDSENKIYIQRLLETDLKQSLLGFDNNSDLKECLKRVWSDSGIKKTFDKRHEMTLMDNSLYLLECMPRILSDEKEYIPTFTDVIYTRSQTAGINVEHFVFETAKGHKERYELVDVGGQRTERRKWMQSFDQVVAVLFVMALSGYDQVLWEDNNVNRFEEALDLLHQMIREKALQNAKFIIFLNKRDLFREKIGKIPFQYKNEYGPSSDYDESIEWIKNKIIKFDSKRTFYFNVTCATDTEDVDRVFQICHDIVLRNAIKKGGFI